MGVVMKRPWSRGDSDEHRPFFARVQGKKESESSTNALVAFKATVGSLFLS